MNAEKLVLGLAGMPGSGKSLVVAVAEEIGYAVVAMGDVVREETMRMGLEPNSKNIGKAMLELRQIEGENVIAKRCLPRIVQARNPKVLVDGIRSLSEVEEFKKSFRKFNLLAIHASPETRFNRLYRRRRSDDPSSWEIFHERDMRELSVGLGNAIAMAEYMISNEEDREVVKDKIRRVLRKVEEKWTK